MRPIQIIKDFTMHAEGSVLISCGNTKVICNATVEEKVPPFLKDTGLGWVTALRCPCCPVPKAGSARPC